MAGWVRLNEHILIGMCCSGDPTVVEKPNKIQPFIQFLWFDLKSVFAHRGIQAMILIMLVLNDSFN